MSDLMKNSCIRCGSSVIHENGNLFCDDIDAANNEIDMLSGMLDDIGEAAGNVNDVLDAQMFVHAIKGFILQRRPEKF